MQVCRMEEWDPQTEHREAQRVALGKESALGNSTGLSRLPSIEMAQAGHTHHVGGQPIPDPEPLLLCRKRQCLV